MARQYTPKQLKEIFSKLSEELRETIFSVETSEAIISACENNGVIDKRVTEIAKYAGQVLMGLFWASEFEQILQKEIGLSQNKAAAIAREINRFVFYPVKPALDQIHDMKIKPTTSKTPEKKAALVDKTPSAPASEDPYKESTEEAEE